MPAALAGATQQNVSFQHPPMDYHALIPEVRDWEEHNNCSFDPGQWIAGVGRIGHAIGYAWAFWPQFVLYDGCVLRKGNFTEETYQGFMEQTKGDKSAVEAVVNHLHIVDLFPASEVAVTKIQVQWLGERLRDMWDAKLKRDFPDRQIIVWFNGNEDCDDLADYQLTASQQKAAS